MKQLELFTAEQLMLDQAEHIKEKLEQERRKHDKENGINSCCCSWCSPSDEVLDDECYPYRFCGNGKIIYKDTPVMKSVCFRS
tara:strand:+ start:41 stop:289 length:249 start_codon:yes stop_codon:yes gene_type:complete